MIRRIVAVSLVGIVVAGCGSRQTDAEYPSASEEVASSEQSGPLPERPAPPTGALWRDDVDATVDAGLGWFLQLVEVEPVLESGRFRGFRVVHLQPASYWKGVDIRPGDVVTSVNGMPIERDTQAFEAFQSLKKSDEIRIKYVRQGRDRELVYRILPPPKEKTSAPAGGA